jgi:hypothetical protein
MIQRVKLTGRYAKIIVRRLIPSQVWFAAIVTGYLAAQLDRPGLLAVPGARTT